MTTEIIINNRKFTVENGGPGSGNFGHGGRPGMRGGSSSGGGKAKGISKKPFLNKDGYINKGTEVDLDGEKGVIEKRRLSYGMFGQEAIYDVKLSSGGIVKDVSQDELKEWVS